MNTEQKAKAYDEALKTATQWIEDGCSDKEKICLESIFPELRESEDERIRKALIKLMTVAGENYVMSATGFEKERFLAYLERQKEPEDVSASTMIPSCWEVKQKPVEYLSKDKVYAIMTKLTNLSYSNLIPLNSDEYKKINEITSDVRSLLDYPIEQKPVAAEDMPYITDEHFYEREPVDSFKYKLAEYMTKSCTKKEGPYGYEYGISAETILKMAEEELLKRGVVQKPAEWSEENEKMLENIRYALRYAYFNSVIDEQTTEYVMDWLKSLRPSWKPSEHQMNILKAVKDYVGKGSGYWGEGLGSLIDDLEKLI